jgi:hypothetical protein
VAQQDHLEAVSLHLCSAFYEVVSHTPSLDTIMVVHRHMTASSNWGWLLGHIQQGSESLNYVLKLHQLLYKDPSANVPSHLFVSAWNGVQRHDKLGDLRLSLMAGLHQPNYSTRSEKRCMVQESFWRKPEPQWDSRWMLESIIES